MRRQGINQRYGHIDDALVVAAERISERIAHVLDTGRQQLPNHPITFPTVN
jgi:hypothetical protein